MRLVEFLIYMLEAQSETLKRLAALFGEEILLQILENAGDLPQEEIRLKMNPSWLQKAGSSAYSQSLTGSPYAELESAMHTFKLVSFFEFHLWAYPHYRAFIESSMDLDLEIEGQGGEAGAVLVEEAVVQAQAWLKKLGIPPEFSKQVEQAAHVPWLRFRTSVLKRIGRRPMGPVY